MRLAFALLSLVLLSGLAVAQQEAAPPPGQAAPAPAAVPPPPGQPAPAAAAVAPPEAGAAAPVEKPADIAKAVSCATLAQQFGDMLTALKAPTAKQKLDENVSKAASSQAGAGRTACMAHDYDAGLDQLRQALAQLGAKAVR